jgi:hypothetical protein
MKKQEAEALLNRGELGPIEPYLEAVATEDRLPSYAIGMCLLRMEEAAPFLRAVLEKAAASEPLSDDEQLLLFRGVYILGGARDTASCQAMLRLLRRPEAELDELFGIGITEGFARIVIGMFDGDIDALFDLIADRAVDNLVRGELLAAAAFLTWNGNIPRERMEGLLRQFFEQRFAEDGTAGWDGWVNAIALLGLRDMVPLVEQAWKEGRVAEWILTRNEFEDILSAAERDPDDVARFEESYLGYIEDVTATLEDFDYLGSDESDVALDEDEVPWAPTEPVRNPWRHVGRNDPCPCGSGKKAKKCCLATGN